MTAKNGSTRPRTSTKRAVLGLPINPEDPADQALLADLDYLKDAMKVKTKTAVIRRCIQTTANRARKSSARPRRVRPQDFGR